MNKFFLTVALFCAALFTFTACDDDDEKLIDEIVDAVKPVKIIADYTFEPKDYIIFYDITVTYTDPAAGLKTITLGGNTTKWNCEAEYTYGHAPAQLICKVVGKLKSNYKDLVDKDKTYTFGYDRHGLVAAYNKEGKIIRTYGSLQNKVNSLTAKGENLLKAIEENGFFKEEMTFIDFNVTIDQ